MTDHGFCNNEVPWIPRKSQGKICNFILTMSVWQTHTDKTILIGWTAEWLLPWANLQVSKSSWIFPLKLACNRQWPSTHRGLNNKQTPNWKSALKHQKKVQGMLGSHSKNKTQWQMTQKKKMFEINQRNKGIQILLLQKNNCLNTSLKIILQTA